MTSQELKNCTIEFNVRRLLTFSLENVCEDAGLDYVDTVNTLLQYKNEGKNLFTENKDLYYKIVDSVRNISHTLNYEDEPIMYIEKGFTDGKEELENILDSFTGEDL